MTEDRGEGRVLKIPRRRVVGGRGRGKSLRGETRGLLKKARIKIEGCYGTRRRKAGSGKSERGIKKGRVEC
jgi:hypothetical protein